MKDIWEKNIHIEIDYWKSMIEGTFHNKDWVTGFSRRVTGIDIFPDHLRKV